MSKDEKITIVVEGVTDDVEDIEMLEKSHEEMQELLGIEEMKSDKEDSQQVRNSDTEPLINPVKRRGRPRKSIITPKPPPTVFDDSEDDWHPDHKDKESNGKVVRKRRRKKAVEPEEEEAEEDDEGDEDGIDARTGKRKSYMQKYKKEWESVPQFKHWVTESLLGPFYFFCKICKNDNRCGKTGIIRHMTCQKHLRNVQTNNQKKSAFEGLICPVFTPFEKVKTRDVEVKYSVIAGYASYLKACDVEAVLINDVIGEGMSLTISERTQAIDYWARAREVTKQHLMVQVGGAPFKDVVKMVRHAASSKVDSLLILPDMFYKPENHYDLLRYLKSISVHANNIPLWYYHKPNYTFVDIDIIKLLTDVSEIETFVGVVYDSGNLEEAIRIMHTFPKYLISVSTNEGILAAFSNGIKSIMGSSLNFMPRIVQDIKKLTDEGKLYQAQESQRFVNKCYSIIQEKGSLIPALKCAMNILTNVKVGCVRDPLVTIWDNTAKNMSLEFKELGIL